MLKSAVFASILRLAMLKDVGQRDQMHQNSSQSYGSFPLSTRTNTIPNSIISARSFSVLIHTKRPAMGDSHPSTEIFNQKGLKYEEAFGHDAGLQKNVQNFLELLPANARVLDCGCGTAKPVSHSIAASGRRVHGIDLSPTMVDLSRKQVPHGTFEEVNMLSYAPSDKFDGVVASLSLFELTREELTTMAHKWFQWLRPNGLLLILVIGADDVKTSPEMWDSDGQCVQRIGWTFMSRTVYITLFTKAGWNSLLEGAGFSIVHTETDTFVPAAEGCDVEPHYFVIARKPSST